MIYFINSLNLVSGEYLVFNLSDFQCGLQERVYHADVNKWHGPRNARNVIFVYNLYFPNISDSSFVTISIDDVCRLRYFKRKSSKKKFPILGFVPIMIPDLLFLNGT